MNEREVEEGESVENEVEKSGDEEVTKGGETVGEGVDGGERRGGGVLEEEDVEGSEGQLGEGDTESDGDGLVEIVTRTVRGGGLGALDEEGVCSAC